VKMEFDTVPGSMKAAVLKDEGFLADVREAQADGRGFHLWWLGQSGFLLQWQGRHLLIDPYLSDSLTTKYASTDKPHVRMSERVVAPDCLGFIDAVTSSHLHTDHLDAETLNPLLRANEKLSLIIPEANRQAVAERLKRPPSFPIGLDAGQSACVAGFRVHAVPAAHEQIERDPHGKHLFLGYVIEFTGGTVYHSGDTIRYDGMAELLRQWSIDVAILPINGRAPERRVAGNLAGGEAAQLAHDIGARCVIPCHYDMFEFNTATPEEFVAACGELRQGFRVLGAGERWSSVGLTSGL
jgi:L-ascorbate metabolism protein UlaG (beta-lactamase superfamily)